MNAQQHQPLSILNAKRIGIGRDFQPNPECMNKKASAFRRVVLGAMAVLGLSIHVFAISRPVPRGTFPNAINKRGEVAGTCIDSIAVAHGFVRDARGGITVFDAPGAGQRQRQGTFATDINNDGTIVGYYIDEKLLHHGFVRDPDGTLTTLDAPGAGEGLRPPVMAHPELRSGQGTVASRVNDRGNIIGYFIDAKNVEHGFLRDKLGTFLAFDVPGSGGTVPESLTHRDLRLPGTASRGGSKSGFGDYNSRRTGSLGGVGPAPARTLAVLSITPGTRGPGAGAVISSVVRLSCHSTTTFEVPIETSL